MALFIRNLQCFKIVPFTWAHKVLLNYQYSLMPFVYTAICVPENVWICVFTVSFEAMYVVLLIFDS